MRIFVTGATGVLGRRVVPQLLAAGHDVHAVARGEAKAAALARAGGRPVAVDLFDPAAVAAAVGAARPEAVLHLATSIPPTSRAILPGAWRDTDRLRSLTSGYLVDAALAAGAERYVQESIAFAYADGGDTELDEDAPLGSGPTERAVAASTAAVQRMTAGGGAGVMLRFGQFYSADSQHIVDLVARARAGKAALTGPADAYSPSLHAHDAARAVLASLSAPAGVYNVVDDVPQRRGEAAETLAAVLGVPKVKLIPSALLKRSARARILTRSRRVSNSAFRAAAGWAPRFASTADGWPSVVAELDATELDATELDATELDATELDATESAAAETAAAELVAAELVAAESAAAETAAAERANGTGATA